MARLGGTATKSPTNDLYIVSGRILGGSATASIKAGKGFALKYVAAGVYRITPDVNFPNLMGYSAIIYSTTGATRQWQIAAKAYVQGGSAGTSVDFETASAGTPTDLGSSDEFAFIITCSRSTVP